CFRRRDDLARPLRRRILLGRDQDAQRVTSMEKAQGDCPPHDSPPGAEAVAPGSWLPGLARALALVLLAAVFYRASSAPIHHIDTWGHWKYGEWIWEHGRLPEREPFSPYSDPSVRLTYSPWLSQLLCYLVYARLGMEGIALLYGLIEVVTVGLYLAAYRRV